MDLQSTGDHERKSVRAGPGAQRPHGPLVLLLAILGGHPQKLVAVFAREYTLADAIEELLATIEDLIVGAERGECMTADLHFVTKCFNDLIDAYDRRECTSEWWNGELRHLVVALDQTTNTAEAAALVRRNLPRLRRRLAQAS